MESQQFGVKRSVWAHTQNFSNGYNRQTIHMTVDANSNLTAAEDHTVWEPFIF
jgi:hypothetical protein